MIVYLISILVYVQGLEVCQEFNTYQQCINQSLYQCKWNSEGQVCEYTTNFLDGCSAFLSRLTCRKQLGYSSGDIAKCNQFQKIQGRFENVCQDIPNLQTEYCTHDLSKHGCLSVQNPLQLCIWGLDNYECTQLEDGEAVQDNFLTKLYSASICSMIEHYLIMHSSLLWDQLNYKPNFVEQAQNQFRKDLGLTVTELVKEYDDPLKIQLANNFVNSNNYFVQYDYGQQLGNTLSNLEIADRTREGCIALEIADDADFDQLIIKDFSGILMGVNHIYCRYIGNAVFVNGGCFKIENELLLTDQEFIDTNNITCTSMGGNLCSYYKNEQFYCHLYDLLDGNEKEYSCIAAEDQNNLYGNGIHYICKKEDYKYLDIDLPHPACSIKCSTYRTDMNKCQLQSSCLPLVTGNDYDNNFQYCAPRLKCQQPGIGKLLCIYLPALCNYQNEECLVINNYQLYTLKCQEVKSKYSCSKVITEDQLCLWLDADLKCINVLDDPLFVQFKSFPINSIVNFNLCMNFRDGYYAYSQEYRVCKQITDLSSYTCNSEYINMELCLALSTQQCRWDFKYYKCIAYKLSDLAMMQCSTLTYVTSSSCTYGYQISGVCIYDEAKYSCLEVPMADLHCEMKGLSKTECLNIDNDYNFCRWINNVCTTVDEAFLESENCSSFVDVNRLVCVRHTFNGQPCLYDDITNNCYISNASLTSCSNKINRHSCQLTSTADCYFKNNECQQITDFKNYDCNQYYVNKQGCIHNQLGNCIWTGSECQQMTSVLDECASMQELSDPSNASSAKVPTGNVGSCQAYIVPPDRMLDIYKYCQYSSATGCYQTQAGIADCGSTLNINIHRCGAYTPNKNCIFFRQSCIEVVQTSKLGQLRLNSIECAQANLNTCQQVATPGQSCMLNDTSYSALVVEKRCLFSTTDGCQIGATKAVNAGYCASAPAGPEKTIFCKFDPSIKQCVVATVFEVCTTLGLSILPCTNQSYGSCIFLNTTCQSGLEGECSQRNQNSCLNALGYKCSWANSTCVQLLEDCSATDRNGGGSSIPSWSICSMSIFDCYANKGICQKSARLDLTCSSPGVSQSVCSKLNLYCKFVDYHCQSKQFLTCEQFQSLEECVWSTTYKCVYDHGACYTQTHKHPECNYYENSNYLYCRQYDECMYNWSTFKCETYLILLDRQLAETSVNCDTFLTQIHCTHQLANKCVYSSNLCSAASVTQCPHMQSNYSKSVCIQYANCDWKITKSGSYCIDTTLTMSCSLMDKTLCLSDISDLYKCVYDGTQCVDNTFTTCSSVQTQLVNYSTCQAILSLDSNQCEYDHQTQLCKFIQSQSTTCATFNGDELGCALIVQSSCSYSAATCSSSTTFSATLNKYGCTSLTTGYYYFNKQNYECLDATVETTRKLIADCSNLNQKNCIEKSSDIELYCHWDGPECKNTRLNENYEMQCTKLNKLSCQRVETTTMVCKWNGTQCLTFTQSAHACSVTATTTTTPYSHSICALATTACMINADNTGCEAVSETNLEYCQNIGLSKTACLNNTPNINCKWIGYCILANLDTTECTEQISKYTCLHITTPGQVCNWSGSACVSISSGDQCSAPASTLQNCKQMTAKSCIFEDNICKLNRRFNLNQCNTMYSKFGCRNVVEQSCSWINDECQQILNPVSCVQNFNKYACMHSPLYCIWNDNDGCHKIPALQQTQCNLIIVGANASVCTDYSLDYCQFDFVNYLCGSTLSTWKTDVTYQLKESDSSAYSQSYLTQGCQYQFSFKECIRNRLPLLMCQWNGSACVKLESLPTTCSNTMNYFACSQANCIWRMNECIANYDLNYDNNPYPDGNIDKSKTITCDTPNISKLTCLNIANMQCQYNSTTKLCSSYSSIGETQCTDIKLVNSLTCIKQSSLQCSYNSALYQCINAVDDAVSLQLYSKFACLNTKFNRTYWNNGCHIITDNFYCNEQYQTNAMTCALVWDQLQCVYDIHLKVCHSEFNINSVKCTDAGLNYFACVNGQYEPCIWSNNVCKQFTNTAQKCNAVTDVNELSCKSITSEACLFDYQYKRCLFIDQKQPCNIIGLNKLGCQLNGSCSWNSDYLRCECGKVTTFCSDSNCLSNSFCNPNTCQMKKCEDYTYSECKDVKHSKICYSNIYKQCQSATKCEDILYVDYGVCQNYYFDGYACTQVGTKCASHDNFDLICPYVANCDHPKCILDGSCRAKTCSDYQICPDSCLWDSGVCSTIQTCQQLSSTQCNSIQINNQYCSYQIFTSYSSQQVCTMQPCAIFGTQEKLCHGNEISYYSCVLDTYCLPCEAISDKCTCLDATGICSWQNQKCQSVFCSDYSDQSQCELYSRCMWSENCQIRCRFLVLPEDCDARVGECYYDSVHNQCQEGIYKSPDLSVNIDVQIIWSEILSAIVVSLMIL